MSEATVRVVEHAGEFGEAFQNRRAGAAARPDRDCAGLDTQSPIIDGEAVSNWDAALERRLRGEGCDQPDRDQYAMHLEWPRRPSQAPLHLRYPRTPNPH